MNRRQAAAPKHRLLWGEALEPRMLLAMTPLPLADINLVPAGMLVHGPIVYLNGFGYFSGGFGASDYELWRSDGTVNGTTLVKDINPGATGSNPQELTVVNGALFFSANDGTNGTELWKSSGTAAGTVLVKDIFAGGFGSTPKEITAVNNTAFFRATDMNGGEELWKSDGTALGTVQVKDIVPGASSTPIKNLTDFNGTLFFSAAQTSGDWQLWKSDGTSGGTVKVTAVTGATLGLYPSKLTPAGSKLFFTGATSTFGTELWASDGTAGNTTIVADIVPGFGGSFPDQLTAMGNIVYFTPTFGDNELWRSDGTGNGTYQVKDIRPGIGGSLPRSLSVLGGKLYFTANDGTGGAVWYTDGTVGGTQMLTGTAGSNPSSLGVFDGVLVFGASYAQNFGMLSSYDPSFFGLRAVSQVPATDRGIGNFSDIGSGRLLLTVDDGSNGTQLWRSDGTPLLPTFKMTRDFVSTDGSGLSDITVAGSNVFFSAYDPAHGRELVRTNGTSIGTGGVDMEAGPNSSSPSSFVNLNGTLLFAAGFGSFGRELWKTDGIAPPVQVLDIRLGSSSSNPSYLTNVNGTVFFTANDGTNGVELWKTDGTAGGTTLVKDINALAASSNPTALTNVNGKLFFAADDGSNGIELWTSDGTAAGTHQVTSIAAGSLDANPSSLTNVNGLLYFVATDGFGPNQIWRTNGTSTIHIATIAGSNTSPPPNLLTNVNGKLFFTANDGTNGTELWRFDPDLFDTRMVKDIRSGSSSSNLAELTAVNNTLFFTADDGTSGKELWKSDGTTAGTVIVKDIVTGAGGSQPSGLTKVFGGLVFTANSSSNGRELWTSDGTAAGTVQLFDIAAGGVSSSPASVVQLGRQLIFSADDGPHGREPWSTAPEPDAPPVSADGTVFGLEDTPYTFSVVAFGFPDRKNAIPDNLLAATIWLAPTVGTFTDNGAAVSGGASVPAADIVSGKLVYTPPADANGAPLSKIVFSLQDDGGTAFGGHDLETAQHTLSINVAAVNDPPVAVNQSYGTPVSTKLTVPAKGVLQGATDTEHNALTARLVSQAAHGSVTLNLDGSFTYNPTPGYSGSDSFTYRANDGTSDGNIATVTLDVTLRFGASLGPTLLTDVNTTPLGVPVDGPIVNIGGIAYFTGSDGQTSGNWRSDGTAAGTRLITGADDLVFTTNTDLFASMNGSLYVSGTFTFNVGTELFKTNGTASSAILVKDIQPGTASSSPKYLTNVNGTLYFVANDGTHGQELWKTDGTDAGTTLVKDIVVGSGGSSVQGLTNVGGTLFFTANDGVNGTELWKSDGTDAGTTLLKDIYTGTRGSSPGDLVNVNGKLFFSADDSANATQLWMSDGSAAGTVPVTTSPFDFSPEYLTNVNGTLFFRSFAGPGTTLWKSDGTAGGTVSVKNFVISQYSHAYPRFLTNLNGTLLFSANDGVNGYQLWKSDGTTNGTVLVKPIHADSFGGHPQYLTNINGTLFFSANTGADGYELWKSDGTAAGTVLVPRSGTKTAAASPSAPFVFNGNMYFAAFDGVNGSELWKSDGTAAGTTLVKDINPGASGSYPGRFTNVNGTLFFVAKDAATGSELWKTDGTPGGTVMVKDLQTGANGSNPYNLTNLNGTLVFVAHDTAAGAAKLFKSDGTAAGTVLLKDVGSNGISGDLHFMIAAGNTLFLSVLSRGELWKSDGTTAGTALIKKTRGATGQSGPDDLTNVNGVVFFSNDDGVNGDELWKSDGTAAGTVLVKDIQTGSKYSNPFKLTNVSGTLFFTATDGTNGRELWKSDGTAGGTVMVKNISTGSFGSNANYLVNVNGTLFMEADEFNVTQYELWKSDGTASGTVLVKDIYPGVGSSNPKFLTNVNGTLFFQAGDNTSGVEMWTSDGTAAGTFRVGNIAAGSASSSPHNFTSLGGQVFFAANDFTHGAELFTLSRTPSAPSGANKTVATLEDTALALAPSAFGFSDPNDSPPDAFVGVVLTTVPATGSFKLNGAAVNAGDFVTFAALNAGGLVFTPAANANGAAYAKFTFQVQDSADISVAGSNLDPTPKTLTIDVTSVNDAPTSADKTIAINEDVPYTLTAVDFALSDPSDTPANGLSAVLLTTPAAAAGTIGLNGTPQAPSTQIPVTLAALQANQLMFTPAANSNGLTAPNPTFTFRVQDAGGTSNGGVDTSSPANTITFNIASVSDAPVGANGTAGVSVATLEDTPVTFASSDFGFSDPNDTPPQTFLDLRIVTGPAHGTLLVDGTNVGSGSVIPVSAITANLLVFVPAPDGNGIAPAYDKFTFKVQDSGGVLNGGQDTDVTARTMSIKVTPLSDPPSGSDATITTPEDATYTLTVADFGFSDPGDQSPPSSLPPDAFAGVIVPAAPLGGTLRNNGAIFTVFPATVSVVDLLASRVTFVPTLDKNAQNASFRLPFKVQDSGNPAGGNDTDPVTHTLTFNVVSVNDAPLGQDHGVNILEDQIYTFNPLDFGFSDPKDSPPDTFLNVKIVAAPTHGTLSVNDVAVASGAVVSVADISAGLVKFVPAANASGAAPPYDQFTFKVQDAGGTSGGGIDADATARTMSFSVASLNDPPQGIDGAVSGQEDADYVFGPSDFGFSDPNDTPANGFVGVKIASLPASGSLKLNGNDVSPGQLVSRTSLVIGQLVYTPPADANGPITLTFQVQDNGGTANGGVDLDPTPNTLTINLQPVNDAPSFVKGIDKNATDESGAVSFAGWASAIVAGPANEAAQHLHFVVQTNTNTSLFAAGPAIDAAGKLTFTPKANVAGSAQVTIALVDDGGTASGGSDTSPPQTFAINITKPRRWHNTTNGLDVNADGHVVAGDALAVINQINAFGAGPVPPGATIGPPFYDVNGDGSIAPNDALAVINQINAFGSGEGEGTGDRGQEALSEADLLALLAADLAGQPRRRQLGEG